MKWKGNSEETRNFVLYFFLSYTNSNQDGEPKKQFNLKEEWNRFVRLSCGWGLVVCFRCRLILFQRGSSTFLFQSLPSPFWEFGRIHFTEQMTSSLTVQTSQPDFIWGGTTIILIQSMGIPKLFRYLVERYPLILSEVQQKNLPKHGLQRVFQKHFAE